MKIEFSQKYTSGSIVVFAFSKQTLSISAKEFDKKTKNSLTKAIKHSAFDGKEGELISVIAPQGIDASRLICVGLGEKKSLSTKTFEKVGAIIAKALKNSKESSISVFSDDISDKLGPHIGFGITLGMYSFEDYKTEKKPITFKKTTIITKNKSQAEKDFKILDGIAKGIYTARNFVSEPPNVLNPPEFAKRTSDMMQKLGVSVEIYDEKKLQEKQMNLILNVGKASATPPRLCIINYQGAKNKDEKPVVLVGKGLCFDSGGLCIKPGASMLSMKQDMAGGASVIGAIHALALNKTPVNVIGIVPMVENAISSNAYRPDDVIKSYSGKTVEIINTDAEGRLVLADALWLAHEFNPKAIINLATLTGAIKIALGSEYAGLFSNNDDFAKKLAKSGIKSNEKLWQFPMDKAYDNMLKSDIADFKHMGKGGIAGSITAACFLQKFIKKDVKWAHLDIAGVAYVEEKTNPLTPTNATGFGVYLLNLFITDNYIS